MRKLIYLAIICFLTCNISILAQDKNPLPPESKSDLELTCEEADARIEDIQKRIDALNKRLQELNSSVAKSEDNLKKDTKELLDCEQEVLALIGATEADLESFRQQIGVLEGKIRQMKALSNDVLADRRPEVIVLANELLELRKNKLSVIPEFFDKLVSLCREIRGLYREKKVSGYTVGTWAQDRDCL